MPPERYLLRTPLLQSIVEESLHSQQSFLVLRLTNQFDAFFNPNTDSETNAMSNTPSIFKTEEIDRHWLCNGELRRQCQHRSHCERDCPSWRTVKLERRTHVVVRVSGCGMIKLHAQRYGMQTQQGVLFVIYSWSGSWKQIALTR